MTEPPHKPPALTSDSLLRRSSPSSPITSLAISQRGDLLFVAKASRITVHCISSSTHVRSFPNFAEGAVKAFAFSSDGARVYTAHQDAKIRVWRSAASHSLVASLPTATDFLLRFAFPGNYVSVRRHRRRLWIEHADAITCLAVHGGLLFSVSWDKTLKVWRAADLRCLQSIEAHDDAVNAVAVSREGAVYTGSADGGIRVWRRACAPGKACYALAATLEGHKSAVNALVVSSEGSLLFSGSCDKRIIVWEEEAPTGVIVGHCSAVMCLASAGPLIVSGSTDRTVRIWRRGPGGEFACLSVLAGHAGGVRTVAARWVSADGEFCVFSGGADGEVKEWKVKGLVLAGA
ncbi:transducin/WD40 repeat-like superfamily protein [Wolffia australiana]